MITHNTTHNEVMEGIFRHAPARQRHVSGVQPEIFSPKKGICIHTRDIANYFSKLLTFYGY